jgi:hypothetical protein
MATKEAQATDSELIATIDPKTMNLADWRLIADILGYKPNWAYTSWTKVKKLPFLKAIDFDRWIIFATFLGYSQNWATRQYLEIREAQAEAESDADEEVA